MDYEQLLEAYNTLHEGEPLDFDETATHESSLTVTPEVWEMEEQL